MQTVSMEKLEFEYHNSSAHKAAYLLLHGIRGGIHEEYTQALLTRLKSRDETVLAINFPYMSRGDDRNGVTNVDEEMKALQTAYDFLKSADKTPIHIIGKSFGAIVASHWFAQNIDDKDADVSIMGYVTGEDNIFTEALRGRLKVVVQGDHDKYASPAEVRADLAAHQIDADVIDIPNADHSYRNINSSNLAEYAFQHIAINELLKHI